MFNRRAPLLLSLLLATLPALAQTTNPPPPPTAATSAVQPAEPPLPKDPNELMQLAAHVNGLGSPDMKPWHLKANYQTYDANGKPKDQGVFEEWWAAPDKYKISYSSPSFNQVQYHNGDQTLMTGDIDWPPFPVRRVEDLLLHPLPAANEIGTQKYEAHDVKAGQTTLKCLQLAAPSQHFAITTFCINEQLPVLRIEAQYGDYMTYFNAGVEVEGQYVAKQILVRSLQKSVLNIDLTSLSFLPTVNGLEFTAPASASLAPPPPIRVEAGVIAGYKIGGTDVKYPSMAKSRHMQGSVLRATITKVGTISDLHALSGDPLFQSAAVDAVRTWRYKPFLLAGKPVEVETEINIDFVMP